MASALLSHTFESERQHMHRCELYVESSAYFTLHVNLVMLAWTLSGDLKPKPDGFGAGRRLENHKAEPLLFDVEVVRVIPAEGTDPESMDLVALATELLPPDYNRAINKPPPSALSYNSIVYKQT